MKVSKLIKLLSEHDPDEEVYLNVSDGDTRQAYDIGECWFDDYDFCGLVEDEDPDKDYDGLKKVVVIWH
jgi:hypothetical protein